MRDTFRNENRNTDRPRSEAVRSIRNDQRSVCDTGVVCDRQKTRTAESAVVCRRREHVKNVRNKRRVEDKQKRKYANHSACKVYVYAYDGVQYGTSNIHISYSGVFLILLRQVRKNNNNTIEKEKERRHLVSWK